MVTPTLSVPAVHSPTTHSPATLTHLRSDGVSILVAVQQARMPQIVHWGPDLGALTEATAQALAAACIPPIGPNTVDEPLLLTLPLEQGDGYVGHPGIVGSRSGRSWSPRLQVTSIRVDGTDITGWHQAASARLDITGVDTESGLRVVLTIALEPGGLVRLQAGLTNTGDDAYDLDSLTLALPVPARATELLDMGGRWGKERVPQRLPFVQGTHLREGRKGRTGADAATVLHAGTPGFDFAGGDVWAVHTGWSGNHVHFAESVFSGHRVIGGGELLLPGEIRLQPGQTYTTPWIFAVYGAGLDAVARRFHTYLRSRPGHVDTARPVTLNVWEAVYFDHDEKKLLELAERAAELGVERYVLDDGWFGSRRDDTSGLGDWVVSRQAWPNGLHPLVDRVRELGMQFGLWFEPEMVNPDSDLARAHPEWVMSARSQWPVQSRHQQVLNLSIPECYQHIRDQILAILDEYQIGYLKWDHNRDLIEAGSQPEGGRAAVHAQTDAVYRLLAEIKQHQPGLEIESCSSGGARVDLGILEHTDRVWVSDCIDPLERQSMLRWTGQLLPPELLGSHIASGRSHTTGRTHDLNFRAVTAVFGHLGIEWDLTEASERALHELAAWITFYKNHRELLLSGDLVRVDTGADTGELVHGVVAPDAGRAVFAYVLTANPRTDPGARMVLRGLDPEADYLVRPTLVGAAPSGLVAPRWWGGHACDPPEPVDPGHPYPGLQEAISYPGAVFTGAQLMHAGVVPPRLHPDQGVIFLLTRTQ
ncbi:MAG: alpha-galactosidase [Actinomycetales bacterium]